MGNEEGEHVKRCCRHLKNLSLALSVAVVAVAAVVTVAAVVVAGNLNSEMASDRPTTVSPLKEATTTTTATTSRTTNATSATTHSHFD